MHDSSEIDAGPQPKLFFGGFLAFLQTHNHHLPTGPWFWWKRRQWCRNFRYQGLLGGDHTHFLLPDMALPAVRRWL